MTNIKIKNKIKTKTTIYSVIETVCKYDNSDMQYTRKCSSDTAPLTACHSIRWAPTWHLYCAQSYGIIRLQPPQSNDTTNLLNTILPSVLLLHVVTFHKIFPTKALHEFLISHTQVLCQLSVTLLTIIIILRGKHKSWSYLLHNFLHYTPHYVMLSSIIFLSAACHLCWFCGVTHFNTTQCRGKIIYYLSL